MLGVLRPCSVTGGCITKVWCHLGPEDRRAGHWKWGEGCGGGQLHPRHSELKDMISIDADMNLHMKKPSPSSNMFKHVQTLSFSSIVTRYRSADDFSDWPSQRIWRTSPGQTSWTAHASWTWRQEKWWLDWFAIRFKVSIFEWNMREVSSWSPQVFLSWFQKWGLIWFQLNCGRQGFEWLDYKAVVPVAFRVVFYPISQWISGWWLNRIGIWSLTQLDCGCSNVQ